MKLRRNLFAALGVAGTALGLHFASGRATALFYAQMGMAGWLGIVLGGICFGLIIGASCALSRSCGAASGIARFLYGMILIAVSCMLAGEAGHMGALILPVRHGYLSGLAMALLLAAAAAFTGREAVLTLGAMHAVCLCAYLVLLFLAPEYEPGLRYALDLRLENCIPAALICALAHGALSGCLAADAAQSVRVRPAQLGALSGAVYAALLGLSNGIFVRHAPILLRLNSPFTALAAGWGRAGFYLCALMIFLGCTTGLAGIFRAGISQRKSRFSGEN